MAGRALSVLVSTARRRLAWAFGLSLWANAYSYATILAPSLLMAPRYFRGEVEFGAIAQVQLARSAPATPLHTIQRAAALSTSGVSCLTYATGQRPRLLGHSATYGAST